MATARGPAPGIGSVEDPDARRTGGSDTGGDDLRELDHLPARAGGRRRTARRLDAARAAGPSRGQGRDPDLPRVDLARVDRLSLLRGSEPRMGDRVVGRRRLRRPVRDGGGQRRSGCDRRPCCLREDVRGLGRGRLPCLRLLAGTRHLHHPPGPPGRHRRAARDPHVHGGGAAPQPSDDRGLPPERLPGRHAVDPRRDRDRVPDLALVAGGGAIRGTRTNGGGGGGQGLSGAAFGRGDRRIEAARDGGR